jgi:hypothetical protein
MRFGILLLVALLLACSTTGIDSGKPKNGYWWADMNEPAKLWFLQGYGEGLRRADALLRQSVNFDNKKTLAAVRQEPVTSYLDFSGVSYGQSMQGLDEFYNDYLNKRININVAILYIRDQIRGESKAELDKRLEGMRQGAAEPDYDDR